MLLLLSRYFAINVTFIFQMLSPKKAETALKSSQPLHGNAATSRRKPKTHLTAVLHGVIAQRRRETPCPSDIVKGRVGRRQSAVKYRSNT